MTGRQPYIDSQAILRDIIDAVREVQAEVHRKLRELQKRPETGSAHFDKIRRLSGVDTKSLLLIDSTAEEATKSRVQLKYPDTVQVLGEESLISFSTWQNERMCVLLDMIDGTDLVEMDIDLWCSAFVIYDRVRKLVVGTGVALATGQIYSAVEEVDGARVEIEQDQLQVWGCSNVTRLRDARIAYYGQKAKNALAVGSNPVFADALEVIALDKSAPFRIFNVAGNPMMVRLADRVQTKDKGVVTSGVDAVFDCVGQQLHDVVPGAFIAKKAGAFFCDLKGEEYTYERLGELMLNPKTRITYVLAATKELGLELAAALNKKSPAVPPMASPATKRRAPHHRIEQLEFDEL